VTGKATGSRLPVLGAGLLVALLLGLPAGWLRYWYGLFALALGAGAGLLHAWLLGRLGRRWGLDLTHPGFSTSCRLALAWMLAFLGGELIGLGLAQPWFAPLGWLGRLWAGHTVEPIFGVASTTGVHCAFSDGFNGGWWLVFNLIDWAIMYFFMLAMPWQAASRKPRPANKAGGKKAAC
jgi:hypothetical protein